jgi:hypothetical protein
LKTGRVLNQDTARQSLRQRPRRGRGFEGTLKVVFVLLRIGV